jgi:hypothetical protein
MRNNTLALMGALILTLAESGVAAGQYSYPPGSFGYRALGQMLAPPQSAFMGGLPTNVTTRFQGVGRLNGGYDYATPWRPPYQSVSIRPITLAMAAPATFPGQPSVDATQFGTGFGMPTPTAQMGVPGPAPSASPLPPPGYNGPAPFPDQGTGVTSGIETGRAWNYAAGRSVIRMVAVRAEPYVRSPELSALVTRIARTRGMLAGPAIDVYLSGNVALVQGVVRTSASRTVIGNVLGLDPNVSRIDNRLVVRRYISGR